MHEVQSLPGVRKCGLRTPSHHLSIPIMPLNLEEHQVAEGPPTGKGNLRGQKRGHLQEEGPLGQEGVNVGFA